MTNQAQIPRHRVFISFHHDDQHYKDRFVRMMGGNIVDESVGAVNCKGDDGSVAIQVV